MIGWLRGELLARGADGELLVDVGGVGYRVLVPATVLSSVGELGQTVGLFVHTHVREDAIVLYGFATANERRCFEALFGAHGVGPSLALSVLSSLQPDGLIRAVIDGDLEVLCAVPGVGARPPPGSSSTSSPSSTCLATTRPASGPPHLPRSAQRFGARFRSWVTGRKRSAGRSMRFPRPGLWRSCCAAHFASWRQWAAGDEPPTRGGGGRRRA